MKAAGSIITLTLITHGTIIGDNVNKLKAIVCGTRAKTLDPATRLTLPWMGHPYKGNVGDRTASTSVLPLVVGFLSVQLTAHGKKAFGLATT